MAIGLIEWIRKHPVSKGDVVKHRGKDIVVTDRRFDYRECAGLNSIQKDHMAGTLDLYAPIEAYTERWEHKTNDDGVYLSASPIAGTRKRNDLPPVYMQWKQDYKDRHVKE